MLPQHELARGPGQKESRWIHTLGSVEAGFSPPVPAEAGTYADRLQRLEEQVAALTEELRIFKAKLGE